ncbi:hypothetical protein ACXWO4_10675, partial [Streptococcus pyogenes]
LAKETFLFVGAFVAIRGVFAPGTERSRRIAALAVVLAPIAAIALASKRIHAETIVIPDVHDLTVWLRRAPRMIGDATITAAI